MPRRVATRRPKAEPAQACTRSEEGQGRQAAGAVGLPTNPRIVVIDLEATCWDGTEQPKLAADQLNECEIIEIGAVFLNAEKPPFRALVRPRRHPTLSTFCTTLTTITQADVDGALPFPEAWPQFLDWVGPADTVTLASWGAFDPHQIRRDLRRHELPEPGWQTLNIKRAFARKARKLGAPHRGWLGLQRALEWLAWTFEGRPHSALADAQNAARLLAWANEPAPTP